MRWALRNEERGKQESEGISSECLDNWIRKYLAMDRQGKHETHTYRQLQQPGSCLLEKLVPRGQTKGSRHAGPSPTQDKRISSLIAFADVEAGNAMRARKTARLARARPLSGVAAHTVPRRSTIWIPTRQSVVRRRVAVRPDPIYPPTQQ